MPCNPGYLRTSNSNGLCIACSSQCATCTNQPSYCTTCKSSAPYLYISTCLDICPVGVTVTVGDTCVDCSATCNTCAYTPTSCLTCHSGSYLYSGTCTKTCPTGFEPRGAVCQPCADLSNCPYDPAHNVTEPPVNSTHQSWALVKVNATHSPYESLGFPYSATSMGTGCMLALMKMLVPASNFYHSASAVWGVSAFGSWVLIGSEVLTDDGNSTSAVVNQTYGTNTTARFLAEAQVPKPDLMPNLILLLIITGLGVHVILNIVFSGLYFGIICRQDQTFKYWRMVHRPASVIIPAISLLFSFHFIRLFISGICKLKGCQAKFDRISVLFKPLSRLTYISIFCTHLPLIAGQILMLYYYEPGVLLWIFGLDSLIVTVLFTILLICNLRQMEREITQDEMGLHQPDNKIQNEDFELIPNTDVAQLVKMFPNEDLTQQLRPKVRPVKPKVQRKRRLGRSNTANIQENVKPVRRQSYPLRSHETVQVDPSTFEPYDPKFTLYDEPAEEENPLKIPNILEGLDIPKRKSAIPKEEPRPVSPPENSGEEEEVEDVPEILQLEEPKPVVPEPPATGELARMTFAGRKVPDRRLKAPVFKPFKRAPAGKAETQSVSLPEEHSQIPVPLPEVREPELPVVSEEEPPPSTPAESRHSEPVPEEEHVLPSQVPEEIPQETPEVPEEPPEMPPEIPTESQDSSQDLSVFQAEEEVKESESFGPFGTVPDDADLDYNLAIPDPAHPEIVSIPHKPTGQRIRVTKDFNGARIVDLENRVIATLPPVKQDHFDMTKVVIDENDVRYATLTSYAGEQIRVRRNFKGASIVKLEAKAAHPLIGKSVEREDDFQFSNAYADPVDPEVVVVKYNETGENVKVRKTFHKAVIVDDEGTEIGPEIDRNDYDIKKAKVDTTDVHFATLKHKFTAAKVKVKRNFRGAKIIDLEKKVPQQPDFDVFFEPREPEETPFETSFEGSKGWLTPKPPTGRPPIPRRPIEISEMYPLPGTPDSAEQRIRNLGNIINSLDEEEAKQTPFEEVFVPPHYESDDEGAARGRKFLKKPLYQNTGLEQIYGPNSHRSQSSFESDEGPRSGRQRHELQSGVYPQYSNKRLRTLEEIYLSRQGQTRPRVEMEPHGETMRQSAYTDRSIALAGEEIAQGRPKMLKPFLARPPRP